jgi:dolichol-phosphate mannosyltransferase
MSIKYSIVVPLKDEEGNIGPLVQEVEQVMTQLGASWEMVCIDDGSKDATLSLLQEMSKEKAFLRTLVFAKNYGQSSAFDAGFRNARGEFVITMDGDRQNDPTDIPKLIELSANSDLVCGIRRKRRDNILKRTISYLANTIRSRVCRDGIQDTGCSLKLYRRECFNKIKMYHGMHRFLPALFQIEGFRVKEVLVNHRERTTGTTKYNFLNRSFNTVADMFAVRWMRKRHLNYQINKDIL